MKGAPKAAIVGGDSLLGRELRDQLTQRGIPAELKLVGVEGEVAGVIGVEGEEAIVLTAIDAETLRSSKVLFLAGGPSSSARTLELIDQAGATALIVDLTGGLEERPEARLRAPMLEVGERKFPRGSFHVIAHPAAIMVATVLERIQRAHAVERAVVHVFEPASERGQIGLTELQKQTASLFAFQPLDKKIFDAQLSYNMLPRYGEDAPLSLQSIEQRIDRHVATLLGTRKIATLPSLRLIQAPVFHGHSVSFWIEFTNNPGVTAIAESLASAQVEVRGPELDPPTNAGAAGQSGIAAGLIEQDRNHPKSIWMWAVADNFRLSVDNAIEVARPVLEAGRK